MTKICSMCGQVIKEKKPKKKKDCVICYRNFLPKNRETVCSKLCRRVLVKRGQIRHQKKKAQTNENTLSQRKNQT